MNDRKYMVLAFFGFILLCIIYVMNADGTKVNKVFSAGHFYTPVDIGLQQYNSNELVQQLTGSRQITCPRVEMETTRLGAISMGNYYRSSGKKNTYNVTYFPFTSDYLGCNEMPFSADNKDLVSVLNLGNGASLKSESGISISSLCHSTSGEYIEIVAPFDFSFGNTNTIDLNRIVLVSYDKECKITFDNVANWYCAGDIGTKSQTGLGTGNDITDWSDHTHNSVIGNTPNAIVTNGSAGDVVGYATGETTVLIEILDGNSFKELSLLDWINGVEF